MKWNYRLFKLKSGDFHYYSVREVYYRKDESIQSWAQLPVYAYGESLDEIKKDFDRMRQAGELPVLIYDEASGTVFEENANEVEISGRESCIS